MMKKLLKYGLAFVLAVVLLATAFYYLFPETVFKLARSVQRSSANLVKKEIQVDDHKIFYLEGGTGETIVLLHGFGGNKDHWTMFAKHLAGYHLIIPDLPGYGESSQVQKANYGIESQVMRIDRFLGMLKLNKFHVAGNSLGGAIAATYGSKYPEKVLTIALLDTAGAQARSKSDFVVNLENGKNLLLAENAEDYGKFMDLVFVQKPRVPAAFRKVMMEDWIARAEFNKKFWNDCDPINLSLETVLPSIKSPVLIIWGDQDKILDKSGIPFLEKNLKNYKTVVMKDTGHCPMIERPEQTANTYISFLKERK